MVMKYFRWLPLVALSAGLYLAAPAAVAQDNGAAKKPPPGFEKFEPAPESEQVSATNLVVLAYGAVFLFLFGYVVIVARSQAEMSKEMVELARRLDKAEGA